LAARWDQVAQKSKMTTLPLKSESLTSFPLTLGNCQSGGAIFELAARDKTSSKRKAGPAKSSIMTFKWRKVYFTIAVDLGSVLLWIIVVIAS